MCLVGDDETVDLVTYIRQKVVNYLLKEHVVVHRGEPTSILIDKLIDVADGYTASQINEMEY